MIASLWSGEMMLAALILPAFNVIPDFLSLGEARFATKLLGSAESARIRSIILLTDFLVSIVIASVPVILLLTLLEYGGTGGIGGGLGRNLKVRNGESPISPFRLRAAEKGNVVMLIWLGKSLLGQMDKPSEQVFPPAAVTFVVHQPSEPIPPDDSLTTGRLV